MYHCIFFPLFSSGYSFALLCFAFVPFDLIGPRLCYLNSDWFGSFDPTRRHRDRPQSLGNVALQRTNQPIKNRWNDSWAIVNVVAARWRLPLPSLPPFPSPLPHTHTSSAWPTPINHQLSAIISIIRALFVSTWPTSTLRGYSDWLCPVNDAITGRLEKTSVPNPASFNANWISWNVSYV